MSVQIDHLGTVGLREEGGLILEVRRRAVIPNLPSGDVETVLTSMLSEGGLPTAGHVLTIGGQVVILEDREAAIDTDGRGVVDLVYRRQDTNLTAIPLVEYSSRDRTSELDIHGDQITVEHNGTTQGGEVTWSDLYVSLTYEFTVDVDAIGGFLFPYVGRVNSAVWQLGDPATWRNTQTSARIVNATSTPKRWRVRMVFEYDGYGHQPSVVFIDPETGRPPVGLTADVGYKTVERIGEADFNDLLA